MKLKTIIFCAAALLMARAASAQVYFRPAYGTVTPETVLTDSGITNMDRYSFSGEMFNTGKQTKNGWGKSSKGDFVDFLGTNLTSLPDGYINQNNDWLVSAEIDLTDAKKPVVEFELFQNYGVDNTNVLSLWIAPSSGYTKGEQSAEQNGTMQSTPSGEWTKVRDNITTGENNTSRSFSIPLEKYAGGKVRIAFRLTNRLKQNPNNTRMYRLTDLQVKEK